MVVVVWMLESLPPTWLSSTSRRLLLQRYSSVDLTPHCSPTDLDLLDLGTNIDLSGGNLSLVLSSSLES